MRVFLTGSSLVFASACALPDPAVVTRTEAQTEIAVLAERPSEGGPGCWQMVPAPTRVVEVEETVLAEPAAYDAAGAEIRPAIYRKELSQKLEATGQERWFEAVCADQLTPAVIEDLQRALGVRGLIEVPVTGVMDGPTREALRSYQAVQGLDSDVLSQAAARQMGLVAVDLREEETEG